MAILRSDDFEIEMYITVFRGKLYTPLNSNFGNFGFATTETQTEQREDNSFKGDVLQITAIQLPYIVTKHCSELLKNPITFDLREWQFIKLTPKYVEAARKDSQ